MNKFGCKAIYLVLSFIFCFTSITSFAKSIGDISDEAGKADDAISITYTHPFEITSDLILNSPQLNNFSQILDSISRADSIIGADVAGVSSVDGNSRLNRKLSRQRAQAMAKWLEDNTMLSPDIIKVKARGEDWPLFRSLVRGDSRIPGYTEVISIIESDMPLEAQEAAIRALEGGKTWKYMAENIFPKMRSAEVTLNVRRYAASQMNEETQNIDEVIKEETFMAQEPEPGTVSEDAIVSDVFQSSAGNDWRRRMYIKTDLPYWLMFWSNVAFEVDLAPHWSFNLPVYYSAMNYFRSDLKFRVFGFQPGIRYWFKGENRGAYLEAHYGMGWYNFAFGGNYRYQDHSRKTPAIGGGLAAGYRLPISKNGRWAMEFGGGVGVYRLHYDRFQNRPNGKLIDSRKKTLFGIDNINVSISYSFPIEKKKGGDR
ncbi:MAG: DUF3575 domain-containing protein [Muribaculaceae bacterium]|nr:DUF3575 domain-containing protein [Muribaculaceae bacterium]